MKRILLLSATLFISLFGMSQTTVTVNNNTGAPATYRTLQGAIDSVTPGTVILLQGSGKNYGYVTVNKPVVIFGTGYFLGQNSAPYTQAITATSQLEGMVFAPGSQGSIISGLDFFASNLNDGSGNRIVISGTNNIRISRCRFQLLSCNTQGCRPHGFVIQSASNISVSQCYMSVGGFLFYLNAVSGLEFSNNIFVGDPYLLVLSDYSNNGYSYTFRNNSFYGRIAGSNFGNGIFINNVMIHTGPGASSVAGGMAQADHNISNENIFPVGGINITNADPANTFVLYTDPTISSNDGVFQLKAGSPAIGYGNDGTNAGAYGGSAPYVFSGIPAIPNIYFANPQQTGTATGGLKVQLKIKANN